MRPILQVHEAHDVDRFLAGLRWPEEPTHARALWAGYLRSLGVEVDGTPPSGLTFLGFASLVARSPLVASRHATGGRPARYTFLAGPAAAAAAAQSAARLALATAPAPRDRSRDAELAAIKRRLAALERAIRAIASSATGIRLEPPPTAQP